MHYVGRWQLFQFFFLASLLAPVFEELFQLYTSLDSFLRNHVVDMLVCIYLVSFCVFLQAI